MNLLYNNNTLSYNNNYKWVHNIKICSHGNYVMYLTLIQNKAVEYNKMFITNLSFRYSNYFSLFTFHITPLYFMRRQGQSIFRKTLLFSESKYPKQMIKRTSQQRMFINCVQKKYFCENYKKYIISIYLKGMAKFILGMNCTSL